MVAVAEREENGPVEVVDEPDGERVGIVCVGIERLRDDKYDEQRSNEQPDTDRECSHEVERTVVYAPVVLNPNCASVAPMSIAGLVLEGGEDGSCELSFQAAERFASALSFGSFAFQVGARRWVDAALGDRDRWSAQLSWRLPPRSRRWRWLLPELAWSGATPPWRASCASVRKRSIGPISASSFAAVRPPQPGSSSSAGPSVQSASRVAVELDDRAGQRATATDQVAGEAYLHHGGRRVNQRPTRSSQTTRSSGAAGTTKRVDLMQVPTQPLLGAAALVDRSSR